MKHPFTASSLTVPSIAALALTVLGLLGSGWGSAQTLPADYRRATDALTESVSVFTADPVASLDALRRAEGSFVPLSEGLEPGLREGLRATFARAEEAIVNRSETDLRVQAAVLRGGFGRALYRQALSEAATGNLERARSLLSILAGDLGFDRQTFGGNTQRTLQAAFERRLAARSLAGLGTLGEGREARYRTLAQLYGYIFLVQDSPRLPAQTQATLVATIQRLIAGEALEPSLSALRAQLERFAEAAAASGRSRSTRMVVADPETSGPENVAGPVPNPATGADGVGGGVDNGTAATASGADNRLNPVASRARTDPEQTAAQPETLTETGTLPRTPATSASDSAGDPPLQNPNTPVAAPTDPAASLIRELRRPLLIGAGLLALLALALLRPRRSVRTPWQDAALALLLLPAVWEGLMRLAVVLAPAFNLPDLSSLSAYSLFRHPVTQLLWAGLVILAVLCLALGWRTTPRTASEKPAAPSQSPPQPASRPLASVSTLNWDEDF